ncbi:hypothetical protein HUT18_32870 [Streptomyces sp. NA04227]|uniref:hypothetical protein n=1 Tax=Streptomyces sp. NA04227 TaxID=2742136 RepID=UPI00159228EF|nr:hypothetical protein [Streptomyces sp. NA04227]QKW10502.1 hypothetical protein HUT18_32870 [Streptomyces sp. NA04227]
MSRAVLFMAVGMALAFAAWFGGFGAFLLVAALGAVGYGIGRMLDEGVDLREFLSQQGRRR